jgi:hypothetical protein
MKAYVQPLKDTNRDLALAIDEAVTGGTEAEKKLEIATAKAVLLIIAVIIGCIDKQEHLDKPPVVVVK